MEGKRTFAFDMSILWDNASKFVNLDYGIYLFLKIFYPGQSLYTLISQVPVFLVTSFLMVSKFLTLSLEKHALGKFLPWP
jgi:hypothetical protein